MEKPTVDVALVVTEACAWPVLTRFPQGELGLVYFNRPYHGTDEGDLAALISRDDGRTWQDAGVPAPHPGGANRMHIAAGADHHGRWHVLSTGFTVANGKFLKLQRVWHSVAEEPGAVWTINRTPTTPGLPEGVIPHGRIVGLTNGDLAATFYRSQGHQRPSHAWMAISEDDGRTWQARGRIEDGDANETVLLRRSSGNWLAVSRTQADHHMELYESSDDGVSWRPRQTLTLPMQHPADLLRLDKESILLTYGIRNRGLMGIGVRLSSDDGITWGAPAVICQFGEATDCGYPSSVLCADGSVLTAAYSDRSTVHEGYHLLTVRWKLDDFFIPKPLRSISHGRPLEH